ncbi:MAG: M20/M25/M40 family metallo-hydrolase [Anaerolineae bacterium]|nr:M20/M25/M40 family metallo-hydrolase [Anaerolineae bacterium]
MNNHPAVELLTELLHVPAPSGWESGLAGIVQRKLDEMGYAHELDAAGNVVVRLDGRDPTAPLCVFASHMDEIGFVVTRIEPDGRLRVDRSGGLLPWKLGESPVSILGDKETITGVFSMGSTHGGELGEKAITWSDVFILTGLSPAQLQARGVRVGSPGVPVAVGRGPYLFGDPANPLIAAWTFDDRGGVMTLLRLLATLKAEGVQPHQPTIIAFVTSEELGGHGAKHLARQVQPELFVAVDGAPIPAGVPLQIDGRPAIWSKDRLATYDQRLLQQFCQAALAVGTELQTAVYDGAASDASLLAYAGLAPRIACIGHVRENSHGYEVARLAVFDNLLKTLVQFLKTWSHT